MSTIVHSIRIFLTISIFSALIFLTAEPFVARSQGVEDEATLEVADLGTSVSGHPYKVETLLGDKVIGDFVLGPGKVELEIAPGESKTVEITVSNRIGKTHEFNLEVEDTTGSRDGSEAIILLGDDEGPYTLRDYISIPQKNFELEHNKRARVPVTITVPPDAEPGGRYGSVLVSTVTQEAEKGSDSGTSPSSAIVSRIGTLFFITVPGDVDTRGELKKFSTVPEKKWFQEGPIDFQILYGNTGSIHLNPYGELRIANMLGNEVGFVELEPWFAMPQSTRLREVTWDREFLFGKYTATIELNRGYDNIVDVMSYSFWVLPWKLVTAILLGIFAIVFLIRTFFKTFEFKRRREED